MTPEPPDLDWSVPDWLIEYPCLLRLIEELGIDYGCGGKSLAAAARAAGHEPRAVLERLLSAISEAEPRGVNRERG